MKTEINVEALKLCGQLVEDPGDHRVFEAPFLPYQIIQKTGGVGCLSG